MLVDKLRAALSSYAMVARGDLLVVGVSGGPDSVALLHSLTALSEPLGFRLHVAHLNHMLRGAESEADAVFVGALAGHLGWPASVVAQDVAAWRQRQRLSLEDAARRARYRFFAERVDSLGAVGVAVGHTFEDQVETVVQHWLRGAGPGGLRGIRPVTILPLGRADGFASRSVRVLRPFLEVRRSEVVGYCGSHGLRTRADAMNLDPRFLRNRVRRELLPLLSTYNPRIEESIRRAAKIAAADDDFLESAVAASWGEVVSEEDDRLVFDTARWKELAPALQYRFLRAGYVRLVGNPLDLAAVHLDSAVAAVRDKGAGCSLVWPRGVRLVKRYADFYLSSAAPQGSDLTAPGERIAVPGLSLVANERYRISACIRGERCAFTTADRWHADLDLMAVGDVLSVRRRRAGDRFQPLGMAKSKKTQDFLVDAKVPREGRDRVPVVESSRGIAWLAGLRIAEWAKVTSETRAVLCLHFHPVLKNA